MLLAVAVPPAQAAPPAAAGGLRVQTFALNGYVRVLDGQWQGTCVASDGNCYFASSTHAHHHGAAFFRYNPRSDELALLCEDISLVCGEDPAQDVPQGKIHSPLVEADGWLYFATHQGNYSPTAARAYRGAHVVGYELATGRFRDLGVLRPGYTAYSAVCLDAAGENLYVYLTTWRADPDRASRLYKVHLRSGESSELALGKRGAPHRSYWFFRDARGDCWFSIENDRGALRVIRGETGRLEAWENALPWVHHPQRDSPQPVKDRFWSWAQPLDDGQRCAFTLFEGGALWLFDARRAGTPEAFQRVKHIGPNHLAMCLDRGRVYYVQRADGRPGQEGDLHRLCSVAVQGPPNPPIVEHGLLVDTHGRKASRIGGMAADGQGRLYLTGDWHLLEGEQGTLKHWENRGHAYEELRRGQFLAVATLGEQEQ